jgi:hypothetical protein
MDIDMVLCSGWLNSRLQPSCWDLPWAYGVPTGCAGTLLFVVVFPDVYGIPCFVVVFPDVYGISS